MTDRLLIVDDDAAFCEALAGALRRRGFDVATARDASTATALFERDSPRYAVIDLRIGVDSGLALVERAAAVDPPVKVVVLTGYASIATAVEAIKLGAVQYLAKPAEVADIVAALQRDAGGDASVPLADAPLSVRKLEWEHIQQVLQTHDGNVSATARALNMHRRTLQRKLNKRPVGR